MRFKGTIIAVIIIILLVIMSKLAFKQDFARKEIIVEPTEAETLGFLENTAFGVIPEEY